MNYQVSSIIGADRTLARAANVIGAVAPTPSPTAIVPASQGKSFMDYVNDVKRDAPSDIKDGLGTIAGAGLGYYFMKKHPVLGALAGASIGRNAPALMSPSQRRNAICNMAVTGAGVAGSLMMPKHKVIGFLLGWVAGGLVTYKVR